MLISFQANDNFGTMCALILSIWTFGIISFVNKLFVVAFVVAFVSIRELTLKLQLVEHFLVVIEAFSHYQSVAILAWRFLIDSLFGLLECKETFQTERFEASGTSICSSNVDDLKAQLTL